MHGRRSRKKIQSPSREVLPSGRQVELDCVVWLALLLPLLYINACLPHKMLMKGMTGCCYTRRR